jgi:hypothetical protein
MLPLFELLMFLAIAALVIWQVIVPALRDEPLFPWFRYRHLYRERARARAARHEARLNELAATEWRAAYREQDATMKESSQWPSSDTETAQESAGEPSPGSSRSSPASSR